MSHRCILFDLPFCLTREICSVWLGGNGNTGQGLGLKALLRLDTSVCNKQLRQSLLDILNHLDWETILTGRGTDYTGLRMKWVVAREIALPKLVLSYFPHDQDTIRSFFKYNGMVLKVLKLSDFKGAMTLLTKAIASDCKVLETLSLERCNLTKPITDILNKTTSIKEVRFQNRPLGYRSRIRSNEPRGVKIALFEKVTCLSVIKLALLDPVLLEDAEVIARAFPNVKDFEVHRTSGSALTTLLSAWNDVDTLHLTSMKEMSNSISSIVEQVRMTLKTVVIQDMDLWPAENVLSMLLQCDKLSSVTLCMGYRQHPLLVARLAEHCAARLEVLNVGDAQVTDEDVAAITEHCPNLRVLSMRFLGSCRNYELLLRACTRLEKLRLAPHSTYVAHQATDNTKALFTSIAAYCHNLRFLSFLATSFNGSLISILSKCPKLRVFESLSYRWMDFVGKIKGVEVRGVSSACSTAQFQNDF